MTASDSGDIWADLNVICSSLPYITVADLKYIILGVNDECGTHMTRSGKKQDLVDRLSVQFASWKSAKLADNWVRAKAVISQIRATNSAYVKNTRTNSVQQTPSREMSSSDYSGTTNYASAPPTSRESSSPVSPHPPSFSHGYRFKQSPFFIIDRVVSTVLECPESYSSTDRRECNLHFKLDDDHIAQLRTPGSKYQLRLFCTSSKFFSPGYSGTTECLIEFPPTCEIYVNNVQLKNTLLKGIKKRPGTAPPPDLGSGISYAAASNVVKMVYINSGQGPLELKKYYLVVQLVQSQSVDALVDNLLHTRFVSSQEVRRQMVAAMPEDDDIIAGSLKMSLKCPLSFMRISTPCRSSKCTHSQCFDATSWFSVMEQTTTWLCPVCENVLDWRELIIDGFFSEILKTTPDSVEDVLVESDGQWSTSDKKYFSDFGGKAGGSVVCRGPQYDYIEL
ncbi:PINIT domain-containing protein [Mycena sp. CBHHK59/15]|nr:PINIT domain-containing protein [Mycena sp. CBHHK59/15]